MRPDAMAKGEYDILRKLADGAASEVFLARARGTDADVVLKVLRLELTSDAVAVGRFMDEAKVCQQFDHPHVIRHFGAGRLADGRVYLATEYLRGRDLGDWLHSEGPMSPEALVALALPLCDALGHVHGKGVIHRDLKPDNVFLVDGSVPKLLDFGLAHFKGNKSVKTADGLILATPEYTPPEALQGRPADPRSDLYAFGVLMFECLTGHPPFVDPNYRDLLLKHLHEPPPQLPPSAAHLQPIIHRCLAKSPEARFENAAALAQALAESRPEFLERTALSQAVTSTAAPLKLTESVGEQPGQVLGNYQLIRVIGEGAMGRVFLAKHVRLGRQVAVKVLRPEHARSKALIERFFQEARTVNEIDHEHIVEIYDFVEDELGRAYCVMELLSGFSLAELMRRQSLSLDRMLHMAAQMCGALGAGHQAGVVHRDVKPDNVFVTQRSGFKDYVKVLDFGVAKLLKRGDELLAAGTVDGTIVGTPAYMAPEQASGAGTDHRADIYAVGVVLYEMICGRTPFDGQSFGQMVVQIATHTPKALPDTLPNGDAVPPPVRALVMRCLEKDPERRPQTMGELQRALQSLRADASGSRERPRRSSWRRVAVWLTVAGAASAGGYAAWMARPPPPTPEPIVLLPPPLPAAEVVTQVPEPARVTITIRSTPAGAWLSRADSGKGLGTTPFQGTFEKSPEGVTVRFEREGFQPEVRRISLDEDLDLHVDLQLPPSRRANKVAAKKREARSRDDVLNPFDD